MYRAVAGLALLLLPMPLLANDADASVAVGGVVLTREPRISMESERLTISLSKVTVEYEFLNESDKDITTEVAFPIPPYQFTEAAGGIRAFDDFRLWVDGKELPYRVDAKAFLVHDAQWNKLSETRDVSAILRGYGIDITTLGHYYSNGKYSSGKDNEDTVPDFQRLAPATRKRVSDLGLVDAGGGRSVPLWEVRKTYYWRQTLPAHRVLRVRHEYSPGFGFGGAVSESELVSDTCASPSLQKSISGNGNTEWVDYILTTANSWKTPIKRFELVVERGQDQKWYDPNWDYASFCWDGPVKQVGPYRYEASATDFVPKRELKVLFVTTPVADTATGGAAGVSRGRAGGLLHSKWLWMGILVVGMPVAGIWWWKRSRAKRGDPSLRSG
jgi:hypothetical protein